MKKKGENHVSYLHFVALRLVCIAILSSLKNADGHSYLLYLLPILRVSFCHFFYSSAFKDKSRRNFGILGLMSINVKPCFIIIKES